MKWKHTSYCIIPLCRIQPPDCPSLSLRCALERTLPLRSRTFSLWCDSETNDQFTLIHTYDFLLKYSVNMRQNQNKRTEQIHMHRHVTNTNDLYMMDRDLLRKMLEARTSPPDPAAPDDWQAVFRIHLCEQGAWGSSTPRSVRGHAVQIDRTPGVSPLKHRFRLWSFALCLKASVYLSLGVSVRKLMKKDFCRRKFQNQSLYVNFMPTESFYNLINLYSSKPDAF